MKDSKVQHIILMKYDYLHDIYKAETTFSSRFYQKGSKSSTS